MSRGPEQPNLRAPTRCITVELKDLADTQDFDLNGEVEAVYGFEYTEEGHYKRAEIQDKKNPKLESLRNVEADLIENFEYKLVRVDTKWNLTPIIDWPIKYEFLSPYVYFDQQKTFRKALNSGPTHVSLVPMSTSRGEIEIKKFDKKYLLHRKESVVKNATTKLQFMPQTPLPAQFTILLDISIQKDTEEGGVAGVSDNLMRGVSIAWQGLEVEALRMTVVIQNDGQTTKATSSSDKAILNVTPAHVTELTFINLTHLDLIGFYYTDKVLSEDILQMITTLN